MQYLINKTNQPENNKEKQNRKGKSRKRRFLLQQDGCQGNVQIDRLPLLDQSEKREQTSTRFRPTESAWPTIKKS